MAFTRFILRLEWDHRLTTLYDLSSCLGRAGAEVVSIDWVRPGKEWSVCDLTVQVSHASESAIFDELARRPGVRVVHVSDPVFLAHLGGKIAVQSKVPVRNREDLSRVYTPGVAKVCEAIRDDPSKAYALTMKRNTVAIVSDGTAVLGLGDVGPYAAAPVMEGKAMLFKQLAGVDAFPICLDTKDPEEIVRTVKHIAPVFGGINLEDISSPRCYEIETRLQDELDIPVFHDDQHGTAIVVTAGLLNALKVVGKRPEDVRVVVNGVGAAGGAVCKMLLAVGVRRLVPVDRDGAIVYGGRYTNPIWDWLSRQEQVETCHGSLKDVVEGADVFIGLSSAGVLDTSDVRRMARDPIVFALANPVPEISPEHALPHAAIYASGRSDYPNQINNVLAFPGVFRGALDCRARRINDAMKRAAAEAIASVVSDRELSRDYIIPSVFNERVVAEVRKAVVREAIATGAARRIPPDFRYEGEGGNLDDVEDEGGRPAVSGRRRD